MLAQPSSPQPSELVPRYLSAVMRGDRRGALALLVDEGLQRGLLPSQLHLEVIVPVQEEIGRLWQHNRISVAQEHLATSITQLAISHLYPHLKRDPPNGKRVLVACPEGELHEVGPRIAADFLEMAGFDVRYLGASVPADSLVALAREERADLVCLSASLSFNVPALEAAVRALREALPELPVAIGGRVLTWDPTLEARLAPAFVGLDARTLVARACALLGV